MGSPHLIATRPRALPRLLISSMATMAAISCAKKPSDETGAGAEGSAGSDPMANRNGPEDTPYFAWAELYITSPAPGDSRQPGTRIDPMEFNSRFSKSAFARASLRTGIDLDQYNGVATDTCRGEPDAERPVCIDQVKRMHGLCTSIVLDFQKYISPSGPAGKLACKMWSLSAGKQSLATCTDLDQHKLVTGEVQFKASGKTDQAVRFVDVALGAGRRPSDPPTCNDAWIACQVWRRSKDAGKRSCVVQGWGTYKMR